MITKSAPTGQLNFLLPSLREQVLSSHSLSILASQIEWQSFETAFARHYSPDFGCPAKPIRLMVSLIILKHLRDLSDQAVVEQWQENIYFQYFSGMETFTPAPPCVASELVHFRKRIGEEGCTLIFKESIRINGMDAQDGNLTADTTVQEKNITFPTDSKLHMKIIRQCISMADDENIQLRQTYTRTLKTLRQQQRGRRGVKTKALALRAASKIKTIAGRLLRELIRQLNGNEKYAGKFAVFQKILTQNKDSKDKIYSVHEPDVQCISKGKEHKKYEFGSKISLLVTQSTNVIVGALNLKRNCYDGHSLEPALEQYKFLLGKMPVSVTADRGYRGIKEIGKSIVHIPRPPTAKTSSYQKKKTKRRFARRAAIEPIISHLKQDYRLSRNYYKGVFGDSINVLLAASAMNFKRVMNLWKKTNCYLDFFSITFHSIENYFFHQIFRLATF